MSVSGQFGISEALVDKQICLSCKIQVLPKKNMRDDSSLHFIPGVSNYIGENI